MRAAAAAPPSGLSAGEARARLARHGPNELPSAGRRSGWRLALELASEPMLALLVGCGALYGLLGEWTDSAVIAAAAVAMIALAYRQERRTERALEALRELASPRALVVRDGLPTRVSGREVVPGDVVLLEEGDRVPADGALLEAASLACDESLLTGESVPAGKTVWDSRRPRGRPGGEDEPFVWSGTLVARGRGAALVLATGAGTEMGRVGASLAALVPERTALHRETRRLVRVVGSLSLVVCAAVAIGYGLARGSWADGLLSGLSLAMSLIPEEFPVILSVFLALGAWRMSARRVLARRAAAIEALGSATVLCADKTGTLTQNRMRVAAASPAPGAGEERDVLRAAALASREGSADPMERAFLEAGGSAAEAESLSLEREYPFDAARRFSARVWRGADGRLRAAAKGAPEVLLALGGAASAERLRAADLVSRWGDDGLRVLGAAEADVSGPVPDDPASLPWRWVGLAALADPLRPSAREAVALCREAGVRVLIVTGDHPATARGIARALGLEGSVLTGGDLSGLDARALGQRLAGAAAVARVLPEQKLAVVRALQTRGEVVAMTGDGVNDAPALKAADVGVAMGARGSDVAREAAGVVLLDDDFATLVEGVRQGRRIFANVRRAMSFVVSVHMPIAGLALAALAAGWPPLLLPAHILFLELVIDPACTIVFEADPGDPALMRRPPRDPREPILRRRDLAASAWRGAAALAAVLAAAGWAAFRGWPEDRVRAAAFAAIALQNLALIAASLAAGRGLGRALRAADRSFWWTASAAGLATAGALLWPPARALLHLAPLGAEGWAVLALSGAAGFGLMQAAGFARGRFVANR